MPEVGQRVERTGGQHLVDLGGADALELGERQPDAVAQWGVDPLHDVVAVAGVDVEAEHGDPALAGFVEDQTFGVHAGIVGEDAGQEVGRPVRLEPGGLVGRQRERGGVGLAEAEAGERGQHRPDPLHHRQRVAAAERPREEPQLRLGHPLDVAERPALLVGLGVRDAGEQRDHLDHLLVEDDHAVGGPQDRPQVVVEVARLLPPLLDLEVRGDHVALDRTGPEQRDVGDDVGEGIDAGLADQLALARRLDLEDAERLRGADHGVGVGVVEGHLHLVVEVDLDLVDPLDLRHRVCHRGLHPDAEHVELEQPEVLHVVLVELTHREAGVRRLDRGAVEQGRVGEQHAAGVHRDVAWQPVEPLHQLEEEVEPGIGETARGQLGQVAQRHPGVAGADVGEGLGDRVDLPRRHPERATDVAHGMTDPVGVHHRDADAPFAAVAVEDRLVDLQPARGLHVEVDVGQRVAQRREEPLHQQVVAERVDPGDAEQVVDQAARARAAGGAPDPEVADQVGDVADGEEVRGVAQHPDRLELVVEPLPDPLSRGRAVTAADTGLAAHAEQPVGGAHGPVGAGAGREAELGQVDLAEAEVVTRVEGAPVGDRAGPGQQPHRLAVGVGEAALPTDLLGQLGHLLAGLEEPLGVAPIEMTAVERDQPPGGVEDIDGRGIASVGVAHGVGEHRAQPGPAGQRRGVGGVDGGAGTPAALLSRQPVGDQLEQEVLGGDDVAPRRQGGHRLVVAATGDRGADRGGRTEQHHHVSPGQEGREQVEGRHRAAALAGQVDLRDQPADRRPPAAPPTGAAGVGQQRHPGRPATVGGQVTERTTADRGGSRRARPTPVGLSPGGQRRVQRQVDAQHRPDPRPLAGHGDA